MRTVVAYLGPEGTFTESALLAFQRQGCFGTSEVAKLPVESPHEALGKVRNGIAQYACVAIENSVDGPVTHTFDALADGGGVRIFAETEIDVYFSVMVRPGTTAGDVRTFTTHPVARQQVRNWTEHAFPAAEFIPSSSNAAAARSVAEGRADAAIAPQRAADIFELDSIAREVIDVPGARTRFVVVGGLHSPPPPTGTDRSAVVFTLPNIPGALVSALRVFSSRGIDLSRIESRPTRTVLGTYRFHVEVSGHIESPMVATAFQELGSISDELTYLGSWPAM
ncbi:prephenate dehydratase [Corynebacterium pygosceleis]|uniref:Prephenate dehydratase n=1 Tax=Corynebacterium pygosceleis TaxID=2800406 RepID=A0A9Q4CCB3_9CORY|nr:prephenate dehydratase [Corynebacterium pygosceleis]MCK7638224.1 prephenate dehydratase [Corynebacterium pygosceleis]MCK7676254.1 prephenate dehydratase [Corynebacterium pygosceleis]MCL0121586.1 prephenate dehydratase [Corynebacterium pygosceleis]MCX7445783.1 prephenate dehydratase [Corynebacterium pygosceleis]MCX7469380.1 prephenate dehydratase [Corynebacterium pygosceleis]